MESIMSSVMYAASWTFLHSLWMGLALALIVAAIMHFISVDKSGLRYRLSIFTMLLFLIANLGVFISFLDFKSETIQETNEVIVVPFEQVINTDQSNFSNNFINILSAWVDQNFQLIFAAWSIFFLFKIFKMYQGAVWLRKVRTTGTVINDLAVLERLKSRLKINKHITVIESMLIQVPAVSGIIKPVLYLPLGFFNQLSIQDAEAVLLHELAHIKRYDYFVNILQSITETIYFFNLPLLWASNLIREERENCCDDIALQIHQDKLSFVQAIIHFYEKTTSDKELLLGFNGDRLPTFNRINRILNNKKSNFKSMDKMFIGACFLFTTFFGSTSLYLKKDEIKSLIAFENPAPKAINQAQTNSSDTIKKNETLNESNTMQGESVDKQEIKNNDVDNFRPLLDLSTGNMIELNTNNMVELNTEKMTSLNKNKLIELSSTLFGLKPYLVSRAKLSSLLDTIIPDEDIQVQEREEVIRKTEEKARKIEKEARKIEENARKIEKESRKIEKESRKIEKESRKLEEQSRKIEDEARSMEDESRKMDAESKMMEKESRKMEAESKKMEAESKKMENDSKNHTAIIDFLLKEGLIN